MCFKHGGGAFLIPYAIMLAFIGIPCFFMEITIGQYSAMGPVTIYSNLSPLFKGKCVTLFPTDFINSRILLKCCSRVFIALIKFAFFRPGICQLHGLLCCGPVLQHDHRMDHLLPFCFFHFQVALGYMPKRFQLTM